MIALYSTTAGFRTNLSIPADAHWSVQPRIHQEPRRERHALREVQAATQLAAPNKPKQNQSKTDGRSEESGGPRGE